MTLAAFAAHPEHTRGRKVAEQESPLRNVFQRDRDRIIHSTAFRRLEYKTQVFVNHEGDLFRTRLTHSIEVAQLTRGIARTLGLHEDLAEAIALAHDLGHTPFGHAGQDALNHCMRDYGGFEHNLQSLRVVDVLENRYASFDGLNLTFEVREGILKHCSRKNAQLLGDVGQRFLRGESPSLEAQVTNFADEIAYNNHDVDDGLRSGLITIQQLSNIQLFAENMAEVKKLYGEIEEKRLVHETIRRMINVLVVDLCQQSQQTIAALHPASIDDVRKAPGYLVGFSQALVDKNLELKQFLRKHLYQHYRVNRMSAKASRIIEELFAAFMDNPALMPDEHQGAAKLDQARAVADYIAGMTDRYAIREHKRLFAVEETW
ncbi:deoxyguanosinetriphosphate triphosphohydrolase [Methylophilus medardicus]|uniref:Deoxyguanosinetriphosphate triphosphohydrolase-like protein n=1 Tax=Methylophilus medardicus TaxID=2588534 RepID=A0A5B8CPH3_9PROT|nr:deoxyguanosinetriphosphate triphosphohydrolase [Methylophilus medardicus]QDC43163.1 deoxyguanosinetriphosphate triphosphohydrolase [Methylophilus medardicus]QDC48170.1 deoxyguanosinetriphosphate triphosphohydrolase [Methylophilus medardicus]QDC51875.1 deoxyguanosinetriphosphate triphosphohydrolase [Methylophilus medardicus]